MTDVVELFARGYALATVSHPVGLTERARRACLAAVRVAETVPGPSGTPSLLLGELEGIWAVIYDRREKIEQAHQGSFKKVLNAMSSLDWSAIVTALETQLLIDPAITGAQLASEMRTRIVNMISGDLPAADRMAWHSVMSQAILDGIAEGQVAAQGLLAQASGAGIDWELSAEEAKAALSNGILADSTDLWIQRQTQGLGYQVSQKLASLWDAGATREQMLEAIQEILGSTDNIAGVLLDSAIGQSLSQGSLATYAMANVPKADFVTAGDSRVCPACSDAEDGGPYDLSSCPQPPLHPRCRCTVAPSDVFPLSLASSEY